MKKNLLLFIFLVSVSIPAYPLNRMVKSVLGMAGTVAFSGSLIWLHSKRDEVLRRIEFFQQSNDADADEFKKFFKPDEEIANLTQRQRILLACEILMSIGVIGTGGYTLYNIGREVWDTTSDKSN